MHNSKPHVPRELDEITYQRIADATLDELAEFFENLGDSGLCHRNFDVNFSVSDDHVPVAFCTSRVCEKCVHYFTGRRIDCESRR